MVFEAPGESAGIAYERWIGRYFQEDLTFIAQYGKLIGISSRQLRKGLPELANVPVRQLGKVAEAQ